MKGDLTRATFDRNNHFSSVRMQQGRVQLDADWNEQQDITKHRVETEAVDLIGGCGGPIDEAGFGLTPSGNDLNISPGRYYVGGLLCENEAAVPYSAQPDVPLAPPSPGGVDTPTLPPAPGTYLAYLDVWERHLTALDVDHIREVALGGPDTATRTRTVWQVKLHPVSNETDPGGVTEHCLSTIPTWDAATAPSTGEMGALAEASAPSDNPCIVTPGAGFRRLENQLYRVEVHEGGTRNQARFKWSRDNGSIATRLEAQSADFSEWTVSSLGPDAVLRFGADQWVELTDDAHELLGLPGTLVRVVRAEGHVITIDLDPAQRFPAGSAVDMAQFVNPKVRRWDGLLAGLTNQNFVDLEDGVQVRFRGGNGADGQPRRYHTGDYWQVPARTATGDVEWPLDAADEPEWLPAPGIRHHYCRLALLTFDGAAWSVVSDCRHLFPPVTGLTALFYVSGEGQEARPDPTQPGTVIPLAQPLRVGVANGQHPVAGARVRFEVLGGTGQVNGVAGPTLVTTGADGIAACTWAVDATTQAQVVQATLLDVADQPVHLPIRFGANLSVASEVAYSPGNNCTLPPTVTTVQEALDELCRRPTTGGCTTLTLLPGPGWEAALSILNAGEDANLCFQPGDYPLDQRVTLRDMGVLKLTGAGPGTRIVAQQDEAALVFEDCISVTVRDVYVESQRAGSPNTPGNTFGGLSGALTFRDCGAVTVDAVALTCASGAERAASCLSIFSDPSTLGTEPGAGTVRVQHCDLRIGHQQAGMVLVNVRRARVVDNLLRPGRKSRNWSIERLLQNKHYRAAVRSLLLHGVLLNPDDELLVGGTPRGFVLVTAGSRTALFEAGVTLAGEWGRLLAEPEVSRTLQGVQTDQALYVRLQRIVDRILLNEGNYAPNLPSPGFVNWYTGSLKAANTTTGSQGIVIGGTTGRDVHIHGNTILGVHQGVHAGVSRSVPGQQIDQLGTVHITDNEIEVFLAPGVRERHGIFVGNCDSLLILNNHVQVQRFPVTQTLPIDGVRVFGTLGRMVMVRQNHLAGCTTGVRVEPLNQTLRTVEQWRVADNAMPSVQRTVVAPAIVQRSNNVA